MNRTRCSHHQGKECDSQTRAIDESLRFDLDRANNAAQKLAIVALLSSDLRQLLEPKNGFGYAPAPLTPEHVHPEAYVAKPCQEPSAEGCQLMKNRCSY